METWVVTSMWPLFEGRFWMMIAGIFGGVLGDGLGGVLEDVLLAVPVRGLPKTTASVHDPSRATARI
jgi:hypothetical protein